MRILYSAVIFIVEIVPIIAIVINYIFPIYNILKNNWHWKKIANDSDSFNRRNEKSRLVSDEMKEVKVDR